MGLYASAIFLSAFLLFLVQPMLGRIVLPWFGGGPAIWTTCMLFYQTLLLGGYAYSHAVAGRLSLRRQGLLHLVLLVSSLLLLPITPAISLDAAGSQAPVKRILLVLLVSAGAPFFMISTTAPLLQRWFSRRHPQGMSYRLYSLSNAGSMLGLAAYPFLLEPLVGLRLQTLMWSWGYVVFVALTGLCAVRLIRGGDAGTDSEEALKPEASDTRVRGIDRWSWLALSACGSLLLLATTSQMTEDITPVPFLWVLPLGLYLLSFVICFARDRWYDRRLWAPAFFLAIVATVVLRHTGEFVHIFVQVPVYSATLFLGCMVCHGELARLKPDPRRLTEFYLWISVGGALGGVLATIAAPRLLPDYWEYQIALLGTLALLILNLMRDRAPAEKGPRARWVPAGALAATVAVAIALGIQIREDREGLVAGERSFYGVLGVYDYGAGTRDWTRMLYHGAMFQGGQILNDDERRIPTTYYGNESGIAVAIDYLRRSGNTLDTPDPGGDPGLRIGVVGLGVGTIAALATERDTIRFYEIDPAIIELSRRYFRLLEDSPAAQELVLGDARISMQRELQAGQPQRFDVLALDAFSSDAVPAHLLTREAFELYFQHVEPDGILAVHISSIHLDLSPVVRALADTFDKHALRIVNPRDWEELVAWSDWVLLTSDDGLLADERVRSQATPWSGPKKLLWTDDHSSLLPLIERTWQ